MFAQHTKTRKGWRHLENKQDIRDLPQQPQQKTCAWGDGRYSGARTVTGAAAIACSWVHVVTSHMLGSTCKHHMAIEATGWRECWLRVSGG